MCPCNVCHLLHKWYSLNNGLNQWLREGGACAPPKFEREPPQVGHNHYISWYCAPLGIACAPPVPHQELCAGAATGLSGNNEYA